MNDRLAETLKPFTQALENLKVVYFIVGSVASTTFSIARMTQDIDIVAGLKEEHIPLLIEALGDNYHVDDEMIKREVQRQGTFNIIHRTTFFKIDVFPLKSRAYDQTVAARREFGPLGNPPFMEAYLPQPEDVVLAKLEWFIATGRTSEKQWGDITGVLKMQCFNLDLNYLQHWAREIGVADLLEKALDESGIIEATEETESNGDSD
jgi:hypothetical protein